MLPNTIRSVYQSLWPMDSKKPVAKIKEKQDNNKKHAKMYSITKIMKLEGKLEKHAIIENCFQCCRENMANKVLLLPFQ